MDTLDILDTLDTPSWHMNCLLRHAQVTKPKTQLANRLGTSLDVRKSIAYSSHNHTNFGGKKGTTGDRLWGVVLAHTRLKRNSLRTKISRSKERAEETYISGPLALTAGKVPGKSVYCDRSRRSTASMRSERDSGQKIK